MILYIVVGIVFVVAALSLTRFEINEAIKINAPVEKVWQTIVDLSSHSEWNSQLEYLGGDLRPGGRLHLKLSVADAQPYEFKPTISRWNENEQFAWLQRTGLPRVFDGEHFFELEKLDENTTRVTNREEYRGVLSLLMKSLPMMKSAPAGFQKMNAELKKYVEDTQ